MEQFIKIIDEERNVDNKKIKNAFIASEIYKKLKEIEKISFSNESDAYRKMKSLSRKINKVILDNLDSDSDYDENRFLEEILNILL